MKPLPSTLNVEDANSFYNLLMKNIRKARKVLNRKMTLTEKILYAHMVGLPQKPYERNKSYVDFKPDRVAMQDATAQMAILQFMNSGIKRTLVPATVHCDHLIQAKSGAVTDLALAQEVNKEVYEFLRDSSAKFGIGFWGPGAGIIHQVILERYAMPGAMILGSDSHTPNAGGLGAIAIGVGGNDIMDAMAGMPWELKMPKLIGVKLTGQLQGWTSAKDVILKIAGVLTVKGASNAIIEYFGEGTETISCTGKATICNMGAELGATTSIFPYDKKQADYLRATGRGFIADCCDEAQHYLRADAEVVKHPERYYDQIVEIDLSALEPYINGPFTPDLATPVALMTGKAAEHHWPVPVEVALIGSCTNSSYEDISRAAFIAKDAIAKGIKLKTQLIITPGSELVRATIERDGLIQIFEELGAVIMANACGPCIGMWARNVEDPKRPNTIVTSFNRNFAKRNDGCSGTHAFVASPEMVMALALSGRLDFNPLTDSLPAGDGSMVMLDVPQGFELPVQGFTEGKDMGYIEPPIDGSEVEVKVDPDSPRLQLLERFEPWSGTDYYGLPLLIQAKGKCTTDHISEAGSWLKYRGHLDNISNNMLLGAINAFTLEAGIVKNQFTGQYGKVPDVQRDYKARGIGSVVIGDENYGEGSSREHAAMEPRHLGVKVVIVKSFARIHETNLKKQGMLALTFAQESDYDKLQQDDLIDIIGLTSFTPGQQLTMVLHHSDGTTDEILLNHTYNHQQIEWFKAGGALNALQFATT